MEIEAFFDEVTSTLTYLVHDGHAGIVIDPVRGYDPAAGCTSWSPAEKVATVIRSLALEIRFALDTHTHADHLSGLPYFKERFGARTLAGGLVGDVQKNVRDIFGLPHDFPVDGRQFDVLMNEDTRLGFGSLELRATHTPGHTPADMSWQVDGALFVGDTLFMPDYGSARCDFPGGSAYELYESIQRIYAMRDDTRIFTGHDYQPGGRALAFESTVAVEKRSNIQIDARTTRDEFVAFRNEKDATLTAPRLLLPSLQVNVRAGELPDPEVNGTRYLKVPIDQLGRCSP